MLATNFADQKSARVFGVEAARGNPAADPRSSRERRQQHGVRERQYQVSRADLSGEVESDSRPLAKPGARSSLVSNRAARRAASARCELDRQRVGDRGHVISAEPKSSELNFYDVWFEARVGESTGQVSISEAVRKQPALP
jgi:hypothetical protein